jgi:hypothetical protein
MNLLQSSSGKWEEERLLLWREIEQIKEEQALARAHEKKQIDAAHSKIRELASMKWKTWAALIPAVAVVVVELLRLVFARH